MEGTEAQYVYGHAMWIDPGLKGLRQMVLVFLTRVIAWVGPTVGCLYKGHLSNEDSA